MTFYDTFLRTSGHLSAGDCDRAEALLRSALPFGWRVTKSSDSVEAHRIAWWRADPSRLEKLLEMNCRVYSSEIGFGLEYDMQPTAVSL